MLTFSHLLDQKLISVIELQHERGGRMRYKTHKSVKCLTAASLAIMAFSPTGLFSPEYNTVKAAKIFSMNSMKGMVTVSDYFDAWEKAVIDTGKLSEVSLNIESRSGSGKVNDDFIGAAVSTSPTDSNVPADFIFGDINDDKTIDITDLSLLSFHLVDKTAFTDRQMLAADVLFDGTVDLADLAKLRQYLSKKTESIGE